jgi:hypothetical protein
MTDQRAEPKKSPLIPSTMVCRVDGQPRRAGIAGNSSRLARASRSAADGFAAEAATSSIASMRLLSQTMLGSVGGWNWPIWIFPLETRNLSRQVTRGSVLSTGWRDHVADNERRMSLCTSLGSPLVSPDFRAVRGSRSIGATVGLASVGCPGSPLPPQAGFAN